MVRISDILQNVTKPSEEARPKHPDINRKSILTESGIHPDMFLNHILERSPIPSIPVPSVGSANQEIRKEEDSKVVEQVYQRARTAVLEVLDGAKGDGFVADSAITMVYDVAKPMVDCISKSQQLYRLAIYT